MRHKILSRLLLWDVVRLAVIAAHHRVEARAKTTPEGPVDRSVLNGRMNSVTFSPRYTDAQRAAVTSLVVDAGYTARAAAEQAAFGVCTQGVCTEPFSIPVGTVADLAWRERRRRGDEARTRLFESDPAEAIRQMTRELGAIIQSEIDNAAIQPVPEHLPELVALTRSYAGLVKATDLPRGKRLKMEHLRDQVTAMRMAGEADALQDIA